MKKIRLLLVTLVTVLTSTSLHASLNTATAWWNGETFSGFALGQSFQTAGTPAGLAYTGWANNTTKLFVNVDSIAPQTIGSASGRVFGLTPATPTSPLWLFSPSTSSSTTYGVTKTFTNALSEYLYVKTSFYTSIGGSRYTFKNKAGNVVFSFGGQDNNSSNAFLVTNGTTTTVGALGNRATWGDIEFLLDMKTKKAVKVIFKSSATTKTLTNLTLLNGSEVNRLDITTGRYPGCGLDNTTMSAIVPDSIKDFAGVSSLQTSSGTTTTDLSVTAHTAVMDYYCALDTTTANISWSISDYGTLSPADQALVSITRKANNTRIGTLSAGNISADGTVTITASLGVTTITKTVNLLASSTDGFKALVSTQITNGNAAMAAVTDVNPYITGAKNTLTAAINAAQGVVDNASATLTEVQDELAVITAANSAFTTAMTPFNTFVTYIGTVQTAHDAEVRIAPFFTAVKATLNTALTNAATARTTVTSESDITIAKDTLQVALNAFNADIPAYGALETGISSVTSRLAVATPRTGDTRFLMFPAATVATLSTAKATATGVLGSATTVTELNTAKTTLADALTAFNAEPRVAPVTTQYYQIYTYGVYMGDGDSNKKVLYADAATGTLKFANVGSAGPNNNNTKWAITEVTTGKFTFLNKETNTYIAGPTLNAVGTQYSLVENTSQYGLISQTGDTYFEYNIMVGSNGFQIGQNGAMTFGSGVANRFRYMFQFEPISVWAGTGSWNTPANWTASTLPPTGSDITVESGSLTIDEDVVAVNLIAFPGVDVTVAAGKTLTLTGGLTLKSDSISGSATFVDNGTTTVAGATKVEQFITGAGGATPNGRGWYVSSPVASATSNVYSAAGTNQLWSYSEAANSYTEIVNNTDTMAPMKGYYAKIGASTVVSYTGGSLNNGEIKNENLTRTGDVNFKRGYHLIGNPYPSLLDWSAATKTNMLTTMWYRTQNTGSSMVFDTYSATSGLGTNNNGRGAVSQHIPPMQAFWVKVVGEGNTGSIIFNNSMRSHQTGVGRFLRQAEANTQQVLRLQVSNGINSDEAIIAFNADATDELDAFDSPKLSNDNNSIPEIYTLAGNEKLAINGLNAVNLVKEVALGFKTGEENTFTLRANEISNFGSDAKIMLKDKKLNTLTELTSGSSYSFTSSVTDAADRFSVSIAKTATGIQQATSLENLSVIRNTAGQVVVRISGNRSTEGTITIFSALGQKIKTARTTGSNTVLDADLTAGIYLVSVNVAGQKATRKLVIN